MVLMRVDAVIPFFSGLPRDVIVNTFHFEEATLDKTQFAASMPPLLGKFYDTIYGATNTGRANYLDWLNMKFRVFDLSEPSPRVPVEAPSPFATPGSGASTLPTEVAVVASFQSIGLPGEVYQRRYNRVFLGGLMTTVMNPSAAAQFPEITTVFRNKVNLAMLELQQAAPGPGTLWVQVSRAGGSIRTLAVSGGWTDNSPDTQRRRSVDATARSTWLAP